MCFTEEMPKNTESQFISLMCKRVKENDKKIKLIYTLADWMLWKPWYVYQASNFLYWGYIWTDSYFSKDGEKIHPRMTNKIWGRPSKQKMKELWWTHYQGKQFRYAYFICNKSTKKKLLQESTTTRTLNHPKHFDLSRKIQTDEGYRLIDKPLFNSNKMDFYLSTNGETQERLFSF